MQIALQASFDPNSTETECGTAGETSPEVARVKNARISKIHKASKRICKSPKTKNPKKK